MIFLFSCLHDVCRQFLPIFPLLPILGEAVTSTCLAYLSHTGICKAMKERKLPSLLIVIATKLNYWLTAKKIGKKQMPKNGHLTWKAIYQPGKVVAVGYKNGKRVLVETEETRIQLTCNADHLKDGTISVISYMIREFLYLLFIIIVLMYIISVYINL